MAQGKNTGFKYFERPELLLPPVGMTFFAAFARFEYALKASKKYAKGSGGKVEAAWDAFAKDLGPAFFEEVRDNGIAPTLIAMPPRKQVLDNAGRLNWGAAPPPLTKVSELFLAVRCARNNLMHGGKFMEGAPHTRSEALLNDCLRVLDLALDRDSAVAAYF